MKNNIKNIESVNSTRNSDCTVKSESKVTYPCAYCHSYEHFCYNCDRYQPIDNDEGWCGSTKVSRSTWCKDWK